MLSIENKMASKLNFDPTIDDFSVKKCRKKMFS
jgi:hypothetical protein